MESMIAQLVSQFENGTLSRRQLVQTLAMVAAGQPVAAAMASGAGSGPPRVVSPSPWNTVWLDHISFQVTDYKRSVEFYTSLMGWQVKDDTGTQATLDINGTGGIIIRNARNRPAEAPTATSAPKPPVTGVIDHISWGVQPWDTEGVKAELEKRGLAPRADMLGDDFKSFHVKDPDGWDLQISNQTKDKHRL